MKLDFYTDIFPGSYPEYVCLSQTVGKKIEGAKRYRVTVNFPDSAFTGEIDGQAAVEEVKEVDK